MKRRINSRKSSSHKREFIDIEVTVYRSRLRKIPDKIKELKDGTIEEKRILTTNQITLDEFDRLNCHFFIYSKGETETVYLLTYDSSGKLSSQENISDWDSNARLREKHILI